MTMLKCGRRWFGVVCLLSVVQFLWAAQSEVRELKLDVVQGQGAKNVVGQTPQKPLVVRVLDQDNRPVPRATVVFTAPQGGPGGAFETGSQSLITVTDQDGSAVAEGYQPNLTEESYDIQVLARYIITTAIAEIRQRNVVAGASSKKMLRILAIAGAGAGTAFALSSRGGDMSPGSNPGIPSNPTNPTNPSTTPRITFGGSSTGAPR
jgi:hypothetical protein